MFKIVAAASCAAASVLSLRTNVDSGYIPLDEKAEYADFSYTTLPGNGLYENFIQPSDPGLFQWLAGPMLIKELKGKGSDALQVFKKGCGSEGVAGYCDMCAISFSGTDDAYDPHQTFNLTQPSYCGLPEGVVGGGFAVEVRGFWRLPGWSAIQASIQESQCGQLYTVAHSLGGAVASTFAFCVNNEEIEVPAPEDKAAVAGLGKTRLITFGALAPASVPLWSSTKGNCFEGARFYLAKSESQPQPGVAFHLAFLDYLKATYEENGLSDRVPGLKIDEMMALKAAGEWEELSGKLFDIVNGEGRYFRDLWRGAAGGESTAARTLEFATQWGASLYPHSYDPVPTLLYPFKHPLVLNVPLHHSGDADAPATWSTPAGSANVVAGPKYNGGGPKCNPEASSWPRYSVAQTYTANKYRKIAFPNDSGPMNHMPCCYSGAFISPKAENCPGRYGFAGPFVACPAIGH